MVNVHMKEFNKKYMWSLPWFPFDEISRGKHCHVMVYNALYA